MGWDAFVVIVGVPPFLFAFALGRWWAVLLSVGGYFAYMMASWTMIAQSDRVSSDGTPWFVWAVLVMVWLVYPAGTATLGVVTHRALRRVKGKLWRPSL